MSNSIDKDLKFIKKCVFVEFFIVVIVIVSGGLAYGVMSGRWGHALMYSGGLIAGTAVIMGMLYLLAEQRCEDFSRR